MLPLAVHLEIFVYLFCRFLGESRIYAVQRENSFTNRAYPREADGLGMDVDGWHNPEEHKESTVHVPNSA